MICAVVIVSVKGCDGLRRGVCRDVWKGIHGDGIWSDDVMMEVELMVGNLELEEFGWKEMEV